MAIVLIIKYDKYFFLLLSITLERILVKLIASIGQVKIPKGSTQKETVLYRRYLKKKLFTTRFKRGAAVHM